ncbi:MAG: class I SAM-dependent methyltransferase [Actinomycetota bacterium]
MPTPLPKALADVRALLLDVDGLVRAVGAGRRRGHQPRLRRVELRPVDLKAGRRLQVVEHTETQATTTNVEPDAAAGVVDALLAEPFGNWHVETTTATVQLRVTKKGAAQVHRAPTSGRAVEPSQRPHDRVKPRLIEPDDPLFAVLGADADKRRQVDAFLRVLEPAVRRLDRAPLRVVDLGCGNAYLTLAAHRFLAGRPGGARTVGVELRPELVERSAQRAHRAGLEGLTFVPGTIAAADPGLGGVDVVLALHACDTATDEALARAVRWQAPVVLAAPCCHHDLQRQLTAAPHPYGAVTRHAILSERFGDVLTDALRALVLRILGYRVDVVEFVDSRHTPRNAMIRAVRTGAPPPARAVDEYRGLVDRWRITPALARMLAPELDDLLAGCR